MKQVKAITLLNIMKKGVSKMARVQLPKEFSDAYVGENSETIANPMTGESCELTPEAVAVYDLIKGAEMLGLYKTVSIGLNWFKENYAAEYMILLD